MELTKGSTVQRIPYLCYKLTLGLCWFGFSVNVKFKAFGKMDRRKQPTNVVGLIFLHVSLIMISVSKTGDHV